MPTLMTQITFNLLSEIWKRLFVDMAGAKVGPSYTFVPWAGDRLIASGRGIYYVGIAIDADATKEHTFESSLRDTEAFCKHPTLGRAPFWRFLNRLSHELLGAPYAQTQSNWGWSNLLKIGGTSGSPGEWPSGLTESQRPACIVAFREEIAQLKDSQIVVASANEYGILFEAVGEQSRWDMRAHFCEPSGPLPPRSASIRAPPPPATPPRSKAPSPRSRANQGEASCRSR
jgi:hypothetical protein